MNDSFEQSSQENVGEVDVLGVLYVLATVLRARSSVYHQEPSIALFEFAGQLAAGPGNEIDTVHHLQFSAIQLFFSGFTDCYGAIYTSQGILDVGGARSVSLWFIFRIFVVVIAIIRKC